VQKSFEGKQAIRDPGILPRYAISIIRQSVIKSFFRSNIIHVFISLYNFFSSLLAGVRLLRVAGNN
jgi:hypothetical protein